MSPYFQPKAVVFWLRLTAQILYKLTHANTQRKIRKKERKKERKKQKRKHVFRPLHNGRDTDLREKKKELP